MIGVLYFLDKCSKYIHGLLSGSWKVLPMMGYGKGPGGYRMLVAFLVVFRGFHLTIFDRRYNIHA